MSHETEILAVADDRSSVPVREALPLPQIAIDVRTATLADLPFIDALQKQHTKQVGWMPTAQLEGKIKLGHVLIAEMSGQRQVVSGQSGDSASSLTTDHRPLTTYSVGYCIGNDQYFKRDDLGIIYQMNVVPGKRRGLIGATLLKAMFDRAAYGCKLFCCWCAQDIEANKFWEACGFVPLAFRTGSRTKGKDGTPRVHIFWQKRIREGDNETPWWFPSQTTSGSIREDRLVLPIPPGTHWSDAKPVVLPGESGVGILPAQDKKQRKLSGGTPTPLKPTTRRVQFGAPGAVVASPEPVQEKPKREKRVKQKNDPKYIAAARELRDRYLDEVNRDNRLLSSGKYDVSRPLPAPKSAPDGAPDAALNSTPVTRGLLAAA